MAQRALKYDFKFKDCMSEATWNKIAVRQSKSLTFACLHNIAEIIHQIFLQINFAKVIEGVVWLCITHLTI